MKNLDKALITGSTGFLGAEIKNVLQQEFEIYSLNRRDSHYNYSIELEIPDFDLKFDLVIHAAGKAHLVPTTIEESQAFYDVNYKGTLNLLNALNNFPPKYFVFISSVSVYGLVEGELIDEQQELLASDPYGKSKILAESAVIDWCEKHNVVCTILRLPLVVARNPLGNLKSMINAIEKGYYFNIAGGLANKSMVLAEDVAKCIPIVCKIGGIYNLTDKRHPNFYQLSTIIAKQLGKKLVFNMPKFIAFILAMIGDFVGQKFPINSIKLKKITSELTFDDSKATRNFGWSPKPVLENFKVL